MLERICAAGKTRIECRFEKYLMNLMQSMAVVVCVLFGMNCGFLVSIFFHNDFRPWLMLIFGALSVWLLAPRMWRWHWFTTKSYAKGLATLLSVASAGMILALLGWLE